MNSRLTKIRGRLLLIILTAVMLAGYSPANVAGADINPAPNIINLSNDMETFVLHTNIAFSTVDPYTVTVNGEYISNWKMDSLGFFDAIVYLEDIRDTLTADAEEDRIWLEGYTKSGDFFQGESYLLVIDRGLGAGKLLK